MHRAIRYVGLSLLRHGIRFSLSVRKKPAFLFGHCGVCRHWYQLPVVISASTTLLLLEPAASVLRDVLGEQKAL